MKGKQSQGVGLISSEAGVQPGGEVERLARDLGQQSHWRSDQLELQGRDKGRSASP